MTYQPGTRLSRTKNPFEGDKAIYNDVEIIGQSQVQDAKNSEWEGERGTAVSVRPQEFGAVIDLPQGQLEAEYEVTFAPEPLLPAVPLQVRPIDVQPQGLTAEQQFAEVSHVQSDTPVVVSDADKAPEKE